MPQNDMETQLHNIYFPSIPSRPSSSALLCLPVGCLVHQAVAVASSWISSRGLLRVLFGGSCSGDSEIARRNRPLRRHRRYSRSSCKSGWRAELCGHREEATRGSSRQRRKVTGVEGINERETRRAVHVALSGAWSAQYRYLFPLFRRASIPISRHSNTRRCSAPSRAW